VETIEATEYMDDGSTMCLALTINRNDGTAKFNFDVMEFS